LADLVARRVSQEVGTQLGQPVVIDPKAGGGGTIGPTFVKNTAPDGYTLLMGNHSIFDSSNLRVGKCPASRRWW
jgi:tripartite-type tricarboxylate transporter receptor subunit TctC